MKGGHESERVLDSQSPEIALTEQQINEGVPPQRHGGSKAELPESNTDAGKGQGGELEKGGEEEDTSMY